MTDGGYPGEGAVQRARTGRRLLRRAESRRMSLTDLTIAEARDGLRAKTFSAVELTMAHLHAIEALNPRLNAYHHCQPRPSGRPGAACRRGAGGGAGARADRHSAGDQGPVLHRGRAHHGRQPILGPFVPPYESTVTANLLRDGAVFLGKTNMDEFAMGSSNMTSAYGPVENPWKRRQDDTLCWCRAGRPAGRPRRWRRAWRWARQGRTPADRSASRRRSAGWSGSSRPMADARAGGWWRSPRRWTIRVRSPAPCGTARSCWARWPGMIRRIPPAPTCRCRISRRRARAA